MTEVIWKFEIPLEASFDVVMPHGAKILCVQTQQNAPRIWAMVDPRGPTERRSFKIVGTGNAGEIGDGLSYIGTFQIDGGYFVGHLFEVE